MKIAFVTNTGWNVFNFRKGLVTHFLDQGHDVVVLSPIDKYVDEIKKWGVHHIPVQLDQTGTNPIKDVVYLRQLMKQFRKEKPDVALCFTIKSNIYSSIAGWLTRIPTVCNVSGLGTVFMVKGWFGKIAMGLYRFAFRHSSHIFFQNQDDQDLFISNVSLDLNKIGLLPGSGINLDEFEFNKLELSGAPRFLMISRLIEEKGVREFEEAATEIKKEHPSWTFTLVGGLDEKHIRSISKAELQEWIRRGAINYVEHTLEVRQLIKSHDVVVLPSYREGTPRTLLEGAALGRPLIATNVPGCREVVKDGFNGFLCHVQNASNLADKLKLFGALSIDEKRIMGKNSRQFVEERFDENFIIRCYTETITQIIDK